MNTANQPHRSLPLSRRMLQGHTAASLLIKTGANIVAWYSGNWDTRLRP